MSLTSFIKASTSDTLRWARYLSTCLGGDYVISPRTEARDDAEAANWVEFSDGQPWDGSKRRRPNFQERLCEHAEHLSAITVDEANANARSVSISHLKAYSSVQLSYISLPAVGLPSQKRYLVHRLRKLCLVRWRQCGPWGEISMGDESRFG